MIFGIWAATINLFVTVSIALAVFCYSAVLHVKPEYDVNGIRKIAVWCLIVFVFGALRVMAEECRYPSDIRVNGKEQDMVTARVIAAEHRKEGGIRFTIKIQKCSAVRTGALINSRCVLTFKNDLADFYDLIGAEICYSGSVSIPDGARNPRCFDYRKYLKSKGVAYVSSTKSYRILRDEPTIIERCKRTIYKMREEFIKSISGNDAAANDTSSLIRGILFGDTSYISEDVAEDMRRNGTAHILAVSGLHIGLLYSIFRSIRKKYPIPGMSIAFFVLLVVYGTMTMWSVSVTRAIAMVAILELGYHLDRRYDLITSLGFVSMLSLSVNPFAIFGASFVMSYLAVLSLAVIGPVLKVKMSEKVPSGIIASLSVQIGLLPYTAYTFNLIPLGSVIINIPVIFIMSVLMSVFAASIPIVIITKVIEVAELSEFLPFKAFFIICDMLSSLITVLLNIITYINELFADVRILSPDVVSPPIWVLFACYSALFILCSESYRISRVRRKCGISLGLTELQSGIALIVVLMSLMISFSDFDGCEFVMVDVGQGDSIHIKAHGRNFLIDGGGSTEYEIGTKTLKPYLLKNGVRKIDGAFVTHLHTDHYKGITELAREGMVKRLFVYEANSLKIAEICRDTGLDPSEITFIRRGHKITLADDATLEVLWPPAYTEQQYKDMLQNEEDENALSLIMKVTVKGVSLLATGDLGEEGEAELVRLYVTAQKNTAYKSDSSQQISHGQQSLLAADILKVGHHGSKTSSSDEFLDAVSPSVAMIQVGKNNMYGHPSKETLERLSEHGIPVFRNDLQGAVGIDINGSAKNNSKSGLRIVTMMTS